MSATSSCLVPKKLWSSEEPVVLKNAMDSLKMFGTNGELWGGSKSFSSVESGGSFYVASSSHEPMNIPITKYSKWYQATGSEGTDRRFERGHVHGTPLRANDGPNRVQLYADMLRVRYRLTNAGSRAGLDGEEDFETELSEDHATIATFWGSAADPPPPASTTWTSWLLIRLRKFLHISIAHDKYNEFCLYDFSRYNIIDDDCLICRYGADFVSKPKSQAKVSYLIIF